MLIFLGRNVLAQENRGGFVIDDFQVDILVKQDSTLIITERIEVDFSEKRHGIFRDIPVKYKNDQGFEYKMELKVLSVENEKGETYQFQIINEGNDKRIKIGDPTLEISGRQIYNIEYEIKKGIRYFENHDELYWNPIGTAWPTSINQASAQVRFEGGINYFSQTGLCYTGSLGYKEQNCSVEEKKDRVLFKATKSLNSHEGLTIVLNFPKGEIYQPTPAENFWLFIADNWGLFIPLIVFPIMFLLWLKKRRERVSQKTLVAQYQAPDNLTPGELGYLLKERYTGRFLAADIINLAVKGYLKIEETEKSVMHKTIIKKINFIKNIKIIWLMAFLLIAFFVNLDFFFTSLFLVIVLIIFGLQKLKSKEFQFEKIKDWQNSKDLTAHEENILEGLFETKVIGSKVKLKDRKDFDVTKDQVDTKIKNQTEAYFLENSKREKLLKFFLLAAMLFFICLGTVIIAMGRMDIFIGSFSSFLIILIFGILIPKKTTDKGKEVHWKIKGFKHYIDVAENDRSKFYAKENMFEQILPYAIVFGNVDKWAKAFDGIIKESPGWYSSSTSFSVVGFSSSLKSGMVKATTIASTPPPSSSSSSGSGGGGSSGGGGGGGGGGSW